jgi:hypothetical protein
MKNKKQNNDKREQKEVKKLGERWQKRMNLRDWEIKWRVVPSTAFGEAGILGDVEYKLQHRKCRIRILSSLDRGAKSELSLHHTIVHELLHLVFAPFSEGVCAVAQSMEEQQINALASCITRLKPL